MSQHIFCNYLNGVYLEDVYLKQATTDYRTKTTLLIYHTVYKIATIFPSFFLFSPIFYEQKALRYSLYLFQKQFKNFHSPQKKRKGKIPTS